MAESKNRNQRIDALLASIKERLDVAQHQEDLVQAIKLVKSFDGPLKFSHTKPYICAVLAVIAGVIIGGYQYLSYNHLSSQVVILLVLLGIGAIAALVYVWRKNSSISKLADRLFQMDLLFDNGLSQIEVDPVEQAGELASRFNEFDRGNYSQEIHGLYQGHYQGKEHAFDYYFYHFHYVDKRVTVTTDSKGRVRTRTTYDHYDRYGIYLPFTFIRHVALIGKSVSGLSGSTYKPASNKFNRLYRVVADSEMNAARFLKPSVVIACEEIAAVFSELNFEFNPQAELCMSFRDDDVITLPRNNDFNSPDGFIREVRQHNALPKLQKALEHIHTLMIYSDSNFRKNS
ncbi:hypothetical protein [Pragia fontium]|uniref:DUF3137 domain-containing protein n=2 Tax=Pragia fontium TaxID=82985 RepID=A0AAJ4WD30_9GAMM|nr:hypothetical protein [Pragia fontium]GKX63730.1 hypothetical protein SOASR032_22990 [Pragia fontium]SFD31963.1 hypothetical protein SAMN02745723_11331 [Pragia fontium DSM 5563 = ATCC 49100]SUB84280.1 Uncharacterised protein [Pragia fontium]VEJ57154.1 Uncharacterised protein [Pragia fontium]